MTSQQSHASVRQLTHIRISMACMPPHTHTAWGGSCSLAGSTNAQQQGQGPVRTMPLLFPVDAHEVFASWCMSASGHELGRTHLYTDTRNRHAHLMHACMP